MHSPPLGDNFPAKHPEVGEITAKKPARLLRETENPFGAASLHPDWRPPHMAGEKIYGGANSDNYRHAERAVMHGHPFFLFRTTEADEQQVWPGILDPPFDFVVVHFQKRL